MVTGVNIGLDILKRQVGSLGSFRAPPPPQDGALILCTT